MHKPYRVQKKSKLTNRITGGIRLYPIRLYRILKRACEK